MTSTPEDAELRDAEDAKVAEALRFAGLKVSSVFDLVNSKSRYAEAIPVLLRLMPELKHHRVREGVARALTVKEARGVAVDPLIREFKRIPFEGDDRDAEQLLKWSIGNALGVVSTPDDLDKLIDLVKERRHGHARKELVLALARFKSRESVETLLEALEDERVAGHAMSALKTLKATEAIPLVQRYLNHSSPWLRKLAKTTVKRLEEIHAREPVRKRSDDSPRRAPAARRR